MLGYGMMLFIVITFSIVCFIIIIANWKNIRDLGEYSSTEGKTNNAFSDDESMTIACTGFPALGGNMMMDITGQTGIGD